MDERFLRMVASRSGATRTRTGRESKARFRLDREQKSAGEYYYAIEER